LYNLAICDLSYAHISHQLLLICFLFYIPKKYNNKMRNINLLLGAKINKFFMKLVASFAIISKE